MTGESSPLARRLDALLRDTVSPRVTLGRVLALLRTSVPAVEDASIWLGQHEHSRRHAAGSPLLTPDRAGRRIPIRDVRGEYGELLLSVSGAGPDQDAEAFVQHVAEALAPIARIDLGLDVPATPRPGAH